MRDQVTFSHRRSVSGCLVCRVLYATVKLRPRSLSSSLHQADTRGRQQIPVDSKVWTSYRDIPSTVMTVVYEYM